MTGTWVPAGTPVKSPGPGHTLASTHMSTPAHIISVGAGALHVLYAVPEHPWLGSLGTCHLPSPSGLQVKGGGTAKSQVSPVEMRLAPATRGPGPGPSPSSASVSQSRRAGQSKANFPPASSFCICLPLLPPSPCQSSVTTSRFNLPTYPPTPSLRSLLPFFPNHLPSEGPALCRVRDPDLGPPKSLTISRSTSFPPSLEIPAAPHSSEPLPRLPLRLPGQNTI